MLQGTVPILPSEYLRQRLQPHQQNLLELAMARQLPASPEVHADLDSALDALELTGVWSQKDGWAFTRAFLVDEEHLFLHCKTFSWDDPSVPQEVRSRKFTWVKNPDEMFIKIMAQCEALEGVLGEPLTVVPEDHPELDAIAFRVVEANEVWLIRRDYLQQALRVKASLHPKALSLMHTASNRRVLGKALSKRTLTNVQTLTPTMAEQGRGVVKEKRRAEERVRIDLASKTMADAFLARARGRK